MEKGRREYFKKGEWNAVCDECGFVFKSGELRRRWDGAMVCKDDFEPRHPQEFVRSKRDKQSVPWTRPEQTEQYVEIGPVDPDSL